MTVMPNDPNIYAPQVGQTELERIVRDLNRRMTLLEQNTPWIAPTLLVGSNYGAGYANIEYIREQGWVTVRGLLGGLGGGLAAPVNIFQFTPGFLPAAQEVWVVYSSSGAVRMDTLPNGLVQLQNNIAPGGWLSFAGIRFQAVA